MAAELKKAEFDLIASLIRSREPARTAAYLILVRGKSNQQAMADTGLSAASVSNTLGRFRLAHEKICKVYRKSA